MSNETYIPGARDTIIAYFGRNAARNLRTHCAPCHNGAHALTDAHKIYGDGYIPTGDRDRMEANESCDICGVMLESLAVDAQAQHDEQQAKWARQSRVEFVNEMGATAAIRCRVY